MSSSKTGYHHGDLARALEDAAMQLLERMPAADISLREVARAADVSHNAPYHHFSDRLGLLKAIAERSMADLLAQVRNATTDAATGLDRPTDVVALWGLIHGLGTLAAAGHFGLDEALVSYEALLGRLLPAGV